MRHQAKWFAISLVIHLGLLALILTLAANAVKYAPPIKIDFTLSTCPVSEHSRKKSEVIAAAPAQPVSVPPPAPVPQKKKPPQPKMAPVPKPVPTPVPVTVPTPSEPLVNSAVTEPVPPPVASNPSPPAATEASIPQGVESGAESTAPEKFQQAYLAENFTGIRDLIIKRLFYPRIARRMGWSGRVVLAFTVKEDGSIRSLRIKESSGYAVLDKSAMDTVKSVESFPRPPVAAEIIMPVQFRLQ